jgi:hypothetical protein
VTSGTGAITTEGAFTDCAQAAPASKASTEINFDLCGFNIISITTL